MPPLDELPDQWRERARLLERYAQRRRNVGDTAEAEDAEQAALDYRLEADALEARLEATA